MHGREVILQSELVKTTTANEKLFREKQSL